MIRKMIIPGNNNNLYRKIILIINKYKLNICQIMKQKYQLGNVVH